MWHSSQIQIVATCLDAQNVLSLPGIPPREVDAAWMHVKDILAVLINETRAADESMHTYVTDDGESGDWLAAASSASARLVNKSSSDIANEEIALWRMRLQPLLSHKNPLTELRRASSVVPWIALLGRKVLAVPALLLPQSTYFLRLVISWPKNGPDWPVIILRNSCTYTRFGRKWGSGRPSRRLAWRSSYMSPTRAHVHKHTHSYTENTLGRIPCFFVVTNNKYQKRKRVHVPDSLSLLYLYYRWSGRSCQKVKVFLAHS